MSQKSKSLKARIRNIAKAKNMSAQVVLQNFMFERFLERLFLSEFKDFFILKGGVLVSSLVGIDKRATMDLDATVIKYPLNYETLEEIIPKIFKVFIDDGVEFFLIDLSQIRKDDPYGGYRIRIRATYDSSIIVPLSFDFTTGDVITPKEVLINYRMLFEDKSISLWSYNVETVLAEKIETILNRGDFNTRPRDFYDIYILTKTQPVNISLFKDALINTSKHRNSSHILINTTKLIDSIQASKTLQSRWGKYSKEYNYTQNITYDEIIVVLRDLFQTV